MTLQVWGAVLLVGLGVLLGVATRSVLDQAFRHILDQAVQARTRQAEERRKLDEDWSALHTARRQQGRCPHCTISLLSERDGYVAPKIVQEQGD
jgi:hypothetical protein